jgi:hypothetical protein
MLGLASGDRRRAVMPTVKGIQGPYRFFFYSFDCNAPPHVHIRRYAQMCKFWLRPIALSKNYGFSRRELNDIRKRIVAELAKIEEAWNEHCGGT